MSHTNQPEYFTINSVCPHDGSTVCLGIFEDMDAVSYRLKRMYTTCGDEYRVECHHLSTAESEAVAYNEQVVSRAKYRREEEMKEARLQEWQEYKDKEDDQMIEDCKNAQPDEPELPDIKSAYKTIGIS